jgi:transposase
LVIPKTVSSGESAYKELGISHNTVHKVYSLVRKAIFHCTCKDAPLLRGEAKAHESYFGGERGRGARREIPVCGILERQGKAKVEIVEEVSAESLLRATTKKVKRGSSIYTDRCKSYDSLVTYRVGHERVDHSQRFSNGRVHIKGIEGFWSYAKERLLRYHGVGKENFGYYLKELEFRSNNRENLDEKVYEALGNWGGLK